MLIRTSPYFPLSNPLLNDDDIPTPIIETQGLFKSALLPFGLSPGPTPVSPINRTIGDGSTTSLPA